MVVLRRRLLKPLIDNRSQVGPKAAKLSAEIESGRGASAQRGDRSVGKSAIPATPPPGVCTKFVNRRGRSIRLSGQGCPMGLQRLSANRIVGRRQSPGKRRELEKLSRPVTAAFPTADCSQQFPKLWRTIGMKGRGVREVRNRRWLNLSSCGCGERSATVGECFKSLCHHADPTTDHSQGHPPTDRFLDPKGDRDLQQTEGGPYGLPDRGDGSTPSPLLEGRGRPDVSEKDIIFVFVTSHHLSGVRKPETRFTDPMRREIAVIITALSRPWTNALQEEGN